MNRDNILKRIKKLAELCEETEPTFNEMMNMDKLFSQDLITVDTMYLQVEQDEYSPNDLIDIMKECNWIWKKRQKVKEVGWDEYSNIDRKIEESLRAGRKIEAIKLYRKHRIDNGTDCSLRQAKDYIDKLTIKMGLDV